MTAQFYTTIVYQGVSEVLSKNRKLDRINVLNAKGSILMKINVSFIVRFILGKYDLSSDTFWTHFVYAK